MIKSDQLDKIILLIAIFINGIVFANSILHHPLSGYDSDENMKYIAVLHEHLPDQKTAMNIFHPHFRIFFPP